jgi:hypothetical protein
VVGFDAGLRRARELLGLEEPRAAIGAVA